MTANQNRATQRAEAEKRRKNEGTRKQTTGNRYAGSQAPKRGQKK